MAAPEKQNLLQELIPPSSYSGVDIRVSVRVYDGGRRTSARREELERLSNELDEIIFLSSSTSNRTRLEGLRSAYLTEMASLSQIQNSYGEAFSLIELKEVQTISYSIYREKIPARAFG